MLRAGLFGLGRMGAHHVKAISDLGICEIVGIADPYVNFTDIKEIIPSGVRTFRSAEDLLRFEKPDVIHIVTPPETHYKLAKIALNRGCHVYVEKPFTVLTTEASDLIGLAQKNAKLICAGHQLLFQRAWNQAKKDLRSIGKIVHIESFFSFRPVRKGVRSTDQLMDILPHPVYLLLQVLYESGEVELDVDKKLASVVTDTSGEVRVIIDGKACKGVLIVTLSGRPVESYVKIVGTNGSVEADFVRDVVITLTGTGADAIAAITNPYRRAGQRAWRTTEAFSVLALKKAKGYPGLKELISTFHDSILSGGRSPVRPELIVETVKVCEAISKKLRNQEDEHNAAAERVLREMERALPSIDNEKGVVLVTGGSGLLGGAVCSRLRWEGWRVRAVSRKLPSNENKRAGIEYEQADLSKDLPEWLFRDVSCIVHCAAETSGGKGDQEKNSILATENILRASAEHRVKKFIHISSIAVLKSSKKAGSPLSEKSPLDTDNLARGPYVWGKAQSEAIVHKLGRELKVNTKVIRPGPLVDYAYFEPPGRLGREVASKFVVMGSPNSSLSVCDVGMAADVIAHYVKNFDAVPKVLNLIDPERPTRRDLMRRLLRRRTDLRSIYIPSWMVSLLAWISIPVQRIVLGSTEPIDIRSAFASEHYDSSISASVIRELSSNP